MIHGEQVKIGFIILCWNSEKFIGNCLKSIINSCVDNYKYHVVVIDNCSTDRSKDIINTISLNVNSMVTIKLIELDKNYGTTYSRNKGFKYIIDSYPETNYYCVLDSDTIINQQAISVLINEIDKDTNCGIIGPKLSDSKGVVQVSGRSVPTLTEKLLKVLPVKSLQIKGEKMQVCLDVNSQQTQYAGYLMSACWLIKSDVIKKIGLLDEKIFYAPEDVEYCIRCWNAGFSVKYCPQASIIHEWQRLSRKKLFSKHNYEHIKGLLYLYKKYGHAFKQYRPY